VGGGLCTGKHDPFSSEYEILNVETVSPFDAGQFLNTKFHVTAAGTHVSYM